MSTTKVSFDMIESLVQPGADAVPETIGAALRRLVFAAQYGAAPDALAADNSAAIAAAIAEVESRGGGTVILPSGELEIDVTTSNVRLVGQGADTSHGAGTNMTEKTVLKWAGSAGATMMRMRTPYGATAQRRYGMGIADFELSGESLAAIGLELDSIAFGRFENIHVRHCTSAQYSLKCGVTGTDGPAGEALDLQLCTFARCSFDTRNTGFSATAAKGWILDGSTNANVSGNSFELLTGIYSSGTAFDLQRVDNNIFTRCSAFRAGGAGAVYTWDLAGHDSGTPGLGAYANLFVQCGWDATYGFRMGASNGADPATVRVNMVIGYDEANGGAPPEVGGNSRVTYLSKAGVLSDITRLVLRQQGADASSGFTTWESASRHDDWVSGSNFNHTGDGFARTDVFQNVNVISAVGAYKTDGVQVLQTRKTGWGAPSGKALIDDLTSHGMIGA